MSDVTSHLLPAWFREPFQPITDVAYYPVGVLAEATDLGPDNVVYLMCILMSFTANLILGQIDSIAMRKIWATTCGLLIASYYYGLNFIFNIGYILVNYLLMMCLERHTAAKLMTFWSAVGILIVSENHNNFSFDEEREMRGGGLGLDLIFMMNFVKFHMLANNYSNAGYLDDPVKGKDLTVRERYFAEPLR